MKTAAERFWAMVRMGDGCWEWTGNTTRNGYGHFSLNGKKVGAHRFAFASSFGEPTDGLCVCHRCDNRRCVRPDHLFLGTHQENIRDRDSKGRTSRLFGSANARTRLTTDQITQIRQRYESTSARVLAKEFGVHRNTIFNIAHGRTRKEAPRG